MLIAKRGSVFCGVLKPADYLSALLSTLCDLEGDRDVIADALRVSCLLKDLERGDDSAVMALVEFELIGPSVLEDIQDKMFCAIADMSEALNEHAPEGMYFGARDASDTLHNGATDFGFWPGEAAEAGL